MRKPRDFDAELKALDDKAKTIRQRKVAQLGELVVATDADALPMELLAGALLAASDTSDMVIKEEWRARGEAFFRGSKRKAEKGSRRQPSGAAARNRSCSQAPGEAGTTR